MLTCLLPSVYGYQWIDMTSVDQMTSSKIANKISLNLTALRVLSDAYINMTVWYVGWVWNQLLQVLFLLTKNVDEESEAWLFEKHPHCNSQSSV